MLRSVVQAELGFLREWRTAWLASDYDMWVALQRSRPGNENPRFAAAGMFKHWCNYAWKPPVGVDEPERRSHLIASATSPFPTMICPSWTVDVLQDPDASIVLDSALTPDRRQRIAARRDSLIVALRAASSQRPRDAWLRGQLVRFLVDQSYRSKSYADEADQVARDCGAGPWWCATLQGYVFAKRSQLDSAQAAFDRARRAMNEETRCGTDNVLAILDPRHVAQEQALPRTCAERAEFASTLWWLSDPFWTDSINERRIEHDARTAALLLVATLPTSERFDWTPATGSDAAAQLATRYGWPSKMFWSGTIQGRRVGTGSSSRTIRFVTGKDPVEQAPSPPFTTQEYKAGRVHLTPDWRALHAPLQASATQWELNAPRGSDSFAWWPFEHMALARPIVAIDEWQQQQWRREHAVRIALAASVPPEMTGFSGGASSTVTASLVGARSAAEIGVLANQNSTTDRPMRLAGVLPFDSTLLSVELRGRDDLRIDARVRFAVASDGPLDSLRPGDVALSTPALIEASSVVEGITLDDVEARLLPSTTLRDAPAVGVYWESYGFSDGDSVETELHVERLDQPGIVERISVALGRNGGEMSGTRVRWKEPGPGQRVSENGARAAIHSHYLSLSTANLRPGDYALTITVRSARGQLASRYRLFSIAPAR